MEVRSEFDPYINMTYLSLGKIGDYCLERSRFLKQRSLKDAIDDAEEIMNDCEEIAGGSIENDDIDMLDKINKISDKAEFIFSKMDLYLICLRPELN